MLTRSVIATISRLAGLSMSLAIVLATGVLGTRAATTEDVAQRSPAQRHPIEGTTVVARAFSFEPAYPAIPSGARVVWVNRDREAHTVTSDVGLFDAEIGPGERFSFTFEEPGTYFFYCLPHDWMIGEVTVDPSPGMGT